MFAASFRSKLCGAAAAALLALAAAPQAGAATCAFGGAGTGDVSVSTACEGQTGGNDSAAVLNAYDAGAGMFSITGWSLDSKWEADENGYDPAGLLSVFGTAGDGKSGSWSVADWAGTGAAALVIKGSNNFAAYLLDIQAGLSGEWSTAALTNNGGQQPGISHISLYVSDTPIAPAPLPAAGLLLAGALAGVAGLRRRRRKAA